MGPAQEKWRGSFVHDQGICGGVFGCVSSKYTKIIRFFWGKLIDLENYFCRMLRHKFFHRARKIVVPESELKKGKGKGKDGKDKENKEEKSEKDKDKSSPDSSNKKKEEKEALITTAAESSQAEGDKNDQKEDKKKPKKVKCTK